MTSNNLRVAAVALLATSLCTPFEAHATKLKIISGLQGAQDGKSKELLALSPTAASQVATQDLLLVLKPTGKFNVDNSGNVEGMRFVTPPYWTTYPYVCRQDRVTLRYELEDKHDAAGKWTGFEARPVGVEAQATYHIEQLPIPGFVPGTSYPMTKCDAQHPDASATWFVAPSDRQAVLAANLFRMAVEDVKAERITPKPCDPQQTATCRQWLLAQDGLPKFDSVEPCETQPRDGVCYVVSFDNIDVTITGKISRDDMEAITPAAITSIRVDNVTVVME